MEVVDLEVGGTKPGGGGLKFQGLDLGEILRIKEGSEEVGDTGVNTDNRVGDRSAEEDSICKARCLIDTRVVDIGSVDLSEGTSSILDLERKRRRWGST